MALSQPASPPALSLMYRGPLSSCNYDCHYCPFAKRRDSADELRDDRKKLERFCDWAAAYQGGRLRIFFTPWGEALTRLWYRQAMIRLSRLERVEKVAVQTNLSCRLDWVRDCRLDSVGFWCTWHPEQVERRRFVEQTRRLDEYGAAYSVGVVGLRENIAAAEQLRRELSPDAYLWINAYKSEPNYYGEEDIRRLEAIDPLFRVNLTRHASRGMACAAGETIVSVDGDGEVFRCHFIKRRIGNLYDADFEVCLSARPCSNESCGCHIGYVHMPHLGLDETFGEGILERIPSQRIWDEAALSETIDSDVRQG